MRGLTLIQGCQAKEQLMKLPLITIILRTLRAMTKALMMMVMTMETAMTEGPEGKNFFPFDNLILTINLSRLLQNRKSAKKCR